MSLPTETPRVALVLAGGAARGAYEVGVVHYIVHDIARSLGRDVPLDILCGTSVGAINIGALAAYADQPKARADRLVEHWRALRISDVLRVDVSEAFAMLRSLVGLLPPRAGNGRGGLVDPVGLERLLEGIPFPRIDVHLRQGRLTAVTLAATHVASGRTIVFVQRSEPGLPEWSHDPTIAPRSVALRAPHALASAAIPLLFPAVRIDGEFYCDGGLRQNVPLSPARRLGATGLIVVNPRYLAPDASRIDGHRREQAFPNPLFLIGKALNALLLDRIDNDVDRLRKVSELLEAGTRLYGEDFVDRMNRELGNEHGYGLRPLHAVLIRASQDIGRLCGTFVRSPAFRDRGVMGRLLRHVAEVDTEPEADLLSYLLFDGEFAGELIDLGRQDARARHDELCTFFEAMLT